MRPLAGQLLLILLLTLPLSAWSQLIRTPHYRITVHLINGDRVSGIPDDVVNGVLAFDASEPVYSRLNPTVPHYLSLSQVERIVVRRVSKRRAVQTGMVVGAILGGYLAYKGSQRNQFRSPVLAGTSIVLSAGAIGAAGALTGALIGSLSRHVLRPLDREEPAKSLERQLRPFTQTYLDGIQIDPY